MENGNEEVNGTLNYHLYVAKLYLEENLDEYAVKQALLDKGLDEFRAEQIVQEILINVYKVQKSTALNEMLVGALILAVGLFLTFGNFGAIFYGAILVGLLKLIKGFVNYP